MCKFNGRPEAVAWSKDGVADVASQDHITANGVVLDFSVVKSSDRGVYRCTASDGSGSVAASVRAELRGSSKLLLLLS